jgi:hypothetical protein
MELLQLVMQYQYHEHRKMVMECLKLLLVKYEFAAANGLTDNGSIKSAYITNHIVITI